LYRILERTAPVAFQFFTSTIEKVINSYEEKRNDWSIRKGFINQVGSPTAAAVVAAPIRKLCEASWMSTSLPVKGDDG